MTGQENLREVVAAGAKAIRERARISPRFGIVLGTGLGGLSREIEVHARIPYGSIPFFPEPRVASHAGAIVLGMLGGQPVAALEGRYHYYEGYSLAEITLPIRVLRALGVEVLVLSNAAGGLNPNFRIGDIMIISDHLNLMGVNPLVGPNDEALGPRFPDMCEPYDQKLIERALEVARRENFACHKGVFVAVPGPNLETRAEYRFLRMIGADVVGMSTVPEVIVAIHGGMRVLGISIITDQCLPDALEPASVEKIIAVASRAEPNLTTLVCGVLERV